MRMVIKSSPKILVVVMSLMAQNVFAQDDKNSSLQSLPSTAAQWQTTAKQDIEAAYQQSVANHPGMFDSHNPDFPTLLESAKREGLALASQINNAQGYAAAIARFNMVLQDGHAGAVALLPKELKQPRRWPGFSAVWRGDGLKVYYSEHAKVSKGDKIIRCNNTPIEPLMRKTIFTFHGQVEQPGHWWHHGRRLLVDDGNPFLPKLKTCDFAKANGSTYSVQLKWTERPESVKQHLVNAYNGDELAIGLHWPTEGIAWIAMPTFSPNEQQKADYQQLFVDLAKQRAQLLTAKAVILDLRHNQGGSSYWSLKVAEQLWGQQVVTYRKEQASEKTQVWWRASKDNTEYVESLKVILKDQPEMYEMVKEVSAGMQLSLDEGAPFYVEKNQPSEHSAGEVTGSDFQNKAMVIVPGQCGSACLDAVDTFKLFANTVLFGAPSSSDSTYMEVRLVDTPSGLSKVIIPNKVYVDRPRANGFYYQPDIPYYGLEWATEALLKQLKSTLE
ncbi:S41 family peptidase [Pseudoalteromonas sp. KG3]|uniref:S41 family peptidase n=1 Tax=Pseudoalteromonas TaxID=53246 RepID=UPI0026598300|nr:S41 family peptidase [Pseudoalteromonas sp. KG3]WKD25882.1 S41 family peptidase [Pseudoalteromonas sp. KG3]